MRARPRSHQGALEVMDLPTGTTLGAWLWAEIGHCALAADRLDNAKELFHRALTEKTAPMYIMRPSVLLGNIEVALAKGRGRYTLTPTSGRS